MQRAFVLMTALPPTLGHLRLIQFSQKLAPTTVIVSTQPSEPYPSRRYLTIKQSVDCDVQWFNMEIEQNPEAEGFWDLWRHIFDDHGFKPGDYIVASEPYGQRLAEELGGVFMPYDLHRTITPVKATPVRHRPIDLFTDMIPEFRKHFVSRVTIFGAESCGKTTLTRDLAEYWKAPWLFEWARPYLEAVGAELTWEKMMNIWHGQRALQESSRNLIDSPVLFQDTDLFSTVGYWDAHEHELGSTPLGLAAHASEGRSDLYLIAPSNIPFEEDQLRYGGFERELPDKYWIDMCEEQGLNYRVLTSSSRTGRVVEASDHVAALLHNRLDFRYERSYN
jgi:HTH-type transcriptional repressor of NAD biosynthesis genes